MNKLLKHKKEEKRLVKLMYKKGLLKEFKIENLFWATCTKLRTKKRKHNRKKREIVYLPQLFEGSTDYWGECREVEVVNAVKESILWEGIDPLDYDEIIEGRKCLTNYLKSTKKLISYLKKLPTVINNNKIRKALICKIQF